MQLIDLSFILLLISTLMIIFMLRYVSKKKPMLQLQQMFFYVLICILIICVGVIIQSIFEICFGVNPIYFEYFIYVGTCLLPVALFFTSLVFSKTKIKFKKTHIFLFIIPILSLLILWTNDYHHLFFEKYSMYISEGATGKYFIVHSIYTYLLFALAIFNFLKYSVKNSGFFSKQSILIIIGALIPIVVNMLGTFGIVNMTVYITPICFTFTVLFFALAIFKFKFLTITPIALQRIVDRISDSYMVLNEENAIVDFNETLIKTFKLNSIKIRNINLIDFLDLNPTFGIDTKTLKESILKVRDTENTEHFQLYIKRINRYFNVEINSINDKGNFLGTLILLKDTTQHMQDMQTIKDNQDLLMEKERLASLGQLIGGIAHNLKTPIMSISGAAEGLTDLINEYDSSIEDPEVNFNDHHEIANDMRKWIKKVREYTSYMSDVITAVKGQAVALTNDNTTTFTIDELTKRVNILMRHELKNALINLNLKTDIDPNISINGDVNSLVQVINNMLSNSIQAYGGRKNENIDMTISKFNNDVVITITDYASGMSKEIKDKLFKEMITTKGKNGTGLGLFMSYSNIRAHFNGNITFESEEGKGTTFSIYIPIG